MTGIKKSISIWLYSAAIFVMYVSCSRSTGKGSVKILILSGRNNHEWQKTTPILVKMYKEYNLFNVSVTDLPDTLKYSDMKRFEVIVSNWNTWPENNERISPEWEKDFQKYVGAGGGAVFIHAGASSFYGWDDYHEIGIGRWGKDTHHGQQTRGKISGFDREHPITRELSDFYIMDEIWEKTDIYPGARPLASVAATDPENSHNISENAAFVNQYGKGRSFFTTLGHNERALLNTGLQTLILRATQWVAHRDITIEPTSEITVKSGPVIQQLSWEQSDTSIALKRGSGIIWRLNFNDRYGRPYFHPLTIDNAILTCTSPPDHPWHLGLWFCWKYINGVNYWEYLDNYKSEETGFRSAGITKLNSCNIQRNSDHSAEIGMELSYYPQDSAVVLTEKRSIRISAPSEDGSYYIDHNDVFTAVADEVILDRTPLQKEPGGRTWGGYAGLSVRFSQDLNSPEIVAPDSSDNFRNNRWVMMRFRTLSGDTAGICMFQDMNHTTPFTNWYVINTPSVPFFYFSPAVLYNSSLALKKGETLDLRYRVWIVRGDISPSLLEAKYSDFKKAEN